MTDDLDARWKRLREATETLVPAPEISVRIHRAIDALGEAPSWITSLIDVGKRGLAAAAVVAALMVTIAYAFEARLETAALASVLDDAS